MTILFLTSGIAYGANRGASKPLATRRPKRGQRLRHNEVRERLTLMLPTHVQWRTRGHPIVAFDTS